MAYAYGRDFKKRRVCIIDQAQVGYVVLSLSVSVSLSIPLSLPPSLAPSVGSRENKGRREDINEVAK